MEATAGLRHGRDVWVTATRPGLEEEEEGRSPLDVRLTVGMGSMSRMFCILTAAREGSASEDLVRV